MFIEIDIRSSDYTIPVSMQAVYAALRAAGVEFDPDERRATIHGGEPDDEPEYVHVNSNDLDRAVEIINNLGYETDEDITEE